MNEYKPPRNHLCVSCSNYFLHKYIAYNWKQKYYTKLDNKKDDKKETNRLKHFKPNTEENVALEMCSIKEFVVMVMVIVVIYSIKEEVNKKMLEVETCMCIEVEVGKEMLGVVGTCKHT